MFCEKRVLRNSAKLTGKHLYQSLFFCNFIKKRLWHRCFPVNFTKFLRTPFFNRTPLVTASVKVESIFRIKPLHVNEAILCIVLQELSMNFQFYFDEFSNSYVKHKNLQLARNYIAE